MLDKAEAAWSPKKPNGHWLPQMQVGLKEVAAIGKIVTRSMRAAFCTLVRDSPFYAALRQEDTSDKDVMSGGELGFQPLGVDDGFADLRTIALWSEKRCTQLAARVFSANLTKHFTVHARNIPRGTPSTTERIDSEIRKLVQLIGDQSLYAQTPQVVPVKVKEEGEGRPKRRGQSSHYSDGNRTRHRSRTQGNEDGEGQVTLDLEDSSSHSGSTTSMGPPATRTAGARLLQSSADANERELERLRGEIKTLKAQNLRLTDTNRTQGSKNNDLVQQAKKAADAKLRLQTEKGNLQTKLTEERTKTAGHAKDLKDQGKQHKAELEAQRAALAKEVKALNQTITKQTADATRAEDRINKLEEKLDAKHATMQEACTQKNQPLQTQQPPLQTQQPNQSLTGLKTQSVCHHRIQ